MCRRAVRGIGFTHDIGVYGNYDALALMVMAAGAYCAVRSAVGPAQVADARPLLLLTANASKYMTIVFDPAVIGWRRLPGPRPRLEEMPRAAALGL